jgi:hypothetical protein
MEPSEWEVGALYEVHYLLDRGLGPYLYQARMIYLGPSHQGLNQEFSLRPLAGTQTIYTKSIKDMTMLESAEAVRRKYNGARGNPPVKQGKRLQRWKGK